MKRVSLVLTLAAAAALSAQAATAQTLKAVKDRGMLSCGVSQGLPGFSSPDDKGNWTGLDVDICRAISAAIFNDPNKIKFVPLSAKDRFTALQSGEIDVLSRNTTWTISRDTSLGANFTGVTYYDGHPHKSGYEKRPVRGSISAREQDLWRNDFTHHMKSLRRCGFRPNAFGGHRPSSELARRRAVQTS